MTNHIDSPFDNTDLEYLLVLKKHFGIAKREDLLKSLIKEFQYKAVNGVIRSVELDIMGYNRWYSDITGSDKSILVLKEEYEKIGNEKLFEIIQNRINSLLKNEINFSVSIYNIKTIKLTFENNLIDVEEIARRDFDYIVFQSTNNDSETICYAIVCYGTVGTYTKTYKISKGDTQLLINSSPQEIDKIIDKYR